MQSCSQLLKVGGDITDTLKEIHKLPAYKWLHFFKFSFTDFQRMKGWERREREEERQRQRHQFVVPPLYALDRGWNPLPWHIRIMLYSTELLFPGGY